MKCPLCGKRKQKRHCPAKGAMICPVCCGEKRGVEIACPADCQYFVEGQRYQQDKVTRRRIKREGVRSYVRKAELYKKNPELFLRIELAIAASYRADTGIVNADVVKAFDLVSKTLTTEKSGLIYDHKSENPLANDLAERILASIREMNQAMRQGGDGGGGEGSGRRLLTDIVIRGVLDEFKSDVLFYMENDSSPTSYLKHLARYHPEKPKPGDRGGGIILPGS